MAKSDGLGKWFKEDWRDVTTGKPCGRKSARGGSKRKYPACRPRAEMNRMSKSQKKNMAAKKQKKGLPKGAKPRNVSWKRKRKK